MICVFAARVLRPFFVNTREPIQSLETGTLDY
jgi:hypothetical protein